VKRILIAGGGTGGHLYPGLAVAEALKRMRPDMEILFVGTERGIEKQVVPEAGYPFRALPIRGFPRKLSPEWVTFGFSLAASMARAASLLRSWRPDVIVGTGGYASVPPAWMGVWMRIPVVLLEQNRTPGMATRATARWARRVCVTYADSVSALGRKDNARVTGNPVRRAVVETPPVPGEPGIVRVLVIGGSRGAHQINVLLTEALAALPPSLTVEFFVQTGRDDRRWVEEKFEASGFRASVEAYVDRMEEAYARADLLVCRAGATTLGEVTARGLPAILIPYPYATAGHQDANAEVLGREGAAEVLDSRTLTAQELARALRAMVEDAGRRARMAERARALGRPSAADDVAAEILKIAEAA
jgi:UDP-N-acetylglucosamine--N-acetylmuramyl-(pentapeptide) pyrophosphoryl-undecaprenol N-acetylglucosamine transferase